MKRKTGCLFVPLTKSAFEDFLRGKSWELRKAERQWNERQIVSGKKAILSRGYNGPRIEGLTVGKVVFGALREIFEKVPWQKIEPRAQNRAEAIKMNRLLLGKARRYVAFRVYVKF